MLKETFRLLPLIGCTSASFGQDVRLSKSQVTALSFAASAPSFVTAELNRWIPGLDLPWELRYGVFPLNSLGFVFTGEWKKGLILGVSDAAAVTAAYFARTSYPLFQFHRHDGEPSILLHAIRAP